MDQCHNVKVVLTEKCCLPSREQSPYEKENHRLKSAGFDRGYVFFLGDEDLYYIMIFYRTIYFKVLFLGWQEEDIDSH